MITDDSASARECRAAVVAVLETIASKCAVIEAWQQVAGEEAGLDHLAEALAAQDPRALELATALASAVGRALGIAALVIDPDEIVLAGEVGTLLEPVLPALREAISRQCLTGAELQVRSGRPQTGRAPSARSPRCAPSTIPVPPPSPDGHPALSGRRILSVR